jgi:imidazole glycerol-phosphate synthase subunit HisH
MGNRIAIIDYGMGNLGSVKNTLLHLGLSADVVGEPLLLGTYDKLILPGVGAFGDAMAELAQRGLIHPIKEFAATGRPFLGICLGMQLLTDKSEEASGVRGLSLIPGGVRRFSSALKCPHMGWNEIEAKKGEKIFKGARKPIYAYFCHSYYVRPEKASQAIGTTSYGVTFASVIRRDNIIGMQFHPEKSQETGLALLKNALEQC